MLSGLITTILALLSEIAPAAGAGTIAKIIDNLVALIPVLVKEAKDLVPMVQNIIAALKGNPAATAEQLDALDALNAQCDQNFEAAATKAEAEDDAAAGSGGAPPPAQG